VFGVGATAASAATGSTVAANCGVGTFLWNINGDNALYSGSVFNGKPSLVRYGALDFQPTTLTYVNTTGRSPLVSHFLAGTSTGELRLVNVTIRTSSTGARSYSTASSVLSTAWTGVRVMQSSGTFLYTLTTSGGLNRYTVGTNYVPGHRAAIATSGWASLRTMSFSGTASLDGRPADGIVGLTSSGALNEYVFPHTSPATSWVYGKLKTSGWNVFKYVSAGGCDSSPARPIMGITPAGAVYLYTDANGYDFSGADFSKAVYKTGGWAAALIAD
jgi:hypothetical protein